MRLSYWCERSPVQSSEEDMIKRIQLAEFSNLYASQSIAAVATYVHTCVAEKMRSQHIPEFVAALKGCLAQDDNTSLSEQLHVAVIAMATAVDLHLQLIDYVVAEARAHASPETPAVVLTKMTTLRSTYLSTVSAQLLTCAQVDLQQVTVHPLIFAAGPQMLGLFWTVTAASTKVAAPAVQF